MAKMALSSNVPGRRLTGGKSKAGVEFITSAESSFRGTGTPPMVLFLGSSIFTDICLPVAEACPLRDILQSRSNHSEWTSECYHHWALYNTSVDPGAIQSVSKN